VRARSLDEIRKLTLAGRVMDEIMATAAVVVSKSVTEAKTKAGLKNARHAIAKLCFSAKMRSPKKRIPRGMIGKLVAKQNQENKGLGLSPRSVVNLVQQMYSKSTASTDGSTEGETDSDLDDGAGTKKGTRGRPVGTTLREMERKRRIKVDLLNAITSASVQLRDKHAPKTVPPAEFDSLVAEKKKEHNVNKDDPYYEVKKGTIWKRVMRENTVVFGMGCISPTLHLELALVDLLIVLADMNKPLSCGEGIQLANALIKDMALADHIIRYKKKMKHACDIDGINEDGTILGRGWWNKFMRRMRHKITSSKGRKFSCNREDWCTYDNFLNMYKCIYEEMVGAGIAEKLDVPVFMDSKGNEVDVESAYGRKCTHKLVKPEMGFLFDETGGNTCMKNDGHVGGRKYVSRSGTKPKLRASESDNHFTTLTVTSLTGEPVLCVVIFKGEQILNSTSQFNSNEDPVSFL
jgi:hypothetical protein